MSHDTHNQASETTSSTTSFRSAIWFVILLAGLFIAAVNFVRAMSHDEEGHGGGHEATEQVHHDQNAAEHATEATEPAHGHATEEATTDSAAHHE